MSGIDSAAIGTPHHIVGDTGLTGWLNKQTNKQTNKQKQSVIYLLTQQHNFTSSILTHFIPKENHKQTNKQTTNQTNKHTHKHLIIQSMHS